MPALDGLAGIVVGAIFGSVFVITCIISAIKAVRDRSRIKKQRAAKKREKHENIQTDGKKKAAIEEIQTLPYTQQNVKCPSSSNKRFSNGNSGGRNSMENLDLSEYSIEAGVDNLLFKNSYSDIKNSDELHHVSALHTAKSNTNTMYSRQNISKRARSHDANFRQEQKLGHLPTDCLAIQKSIRRHSYEVAVGEHSWLSKDPPGFNSSKTIPNAYSYGGSQGNDLKSSVAAFENEAYDKDDYKKT